MFSAFDTPGRHSYDVRMLQTKLRPFTRFEYQQLPPQWPRCEVINGEIVMAPAPNRYHQDISRNIIFILVRYLKRHPIGKAYVAPFDVYLTDISVVQPDVLFVRKENYSILTDLGAEGAPDLVVEILSPQNTASLMRAKRELYARTGVKELWEVDPDRQLVKVYHLRKNPNTPVAIHGPKDKFRSPLLPGLLIRCTEIFAR
jgi:Uma2 family endonuclease